jgi:hypothetical protein
MSTTMRSRAFLLFAGALIATAAAGACVVKAPGSMSPTGFTHDQYEYRVAMQDSTFLGNDWMLDNYYTDGDGASRPKHDGAYATKYLLDSNGDGKVDVKRDALTYDLRFQHRKHEAFIWLRTIPIPNELKDKELRVLMKDYVDEIAGAGYEAVLLENDRVGVTEKRYAAELVTQSGATLAGKEAYWATIDVANIDQIKLTPTTRRVRVELVFVQTGFQYQVKRYIDDTQPISFPVLMIAGYANMPDDFVADRPSFSSLLSQIEIGGRRGFAATTSATADAAATDPTAPDGSARAVAAADAALPRP